MTTTNSLNWDELPMLSRKEKQLLQENTTLLKFARNEAVYQIGNVAEDVFILLKGTVFIEQPHPEGDYDLVKYIVQEKEWFGEKRIWSAQDRSEHAIVRSKHAICGQIPIQVLRNLMHNNEAFTSYLFSVLFDRLKKMELRCIALNQTCAKKRLKNLLIALAPNSDGQASQVVLQHNLSLKELGTMARATAQTMSSILREWKRKNILDFNRNSVVIEDYERFMAL